MLINIRTIRNKYKNCKFQQVISVGKKLNNNSPWEVSDYSHSMQILTQGSVCHTYTCKKQTCHHERNTALLRPKWYQRDHSNYSVGQKGQSDYSNVQCEFYWLNHTFCSQELFGNCCHEDILKVFINMVFILSHLIW